MDYVKVRSVREFVNTNRHMQIKPTIKIASALLDGSKLITCDSSDSVIPA